MLRTIFISRRGLGRNMKRLRNIITMNILAVTVATTSFCSIAWAEHPDTSDAVPSTLTFKEFTTLQPKKVSLVETICIEGLWDPEHVYYPKWWANQHTHSASLIPFLNSTPEPCLATQTGGAYQFRKDNNGAMTAGTDEQAETSAAETAPSDAHHKETSIDQKSVISEEIIPMRTDALR